MNTVNLKKRISYIETRLQELREEYRTAGTAKRQFIVIGAELLKKERLGLENRIEKQKEKENLISFLND